MLKNCRECETVECFAPEQFVEISARSMLREGIGRTMYPAGLSVSMADFKNRIENCPVRKLILAAKARQPDTFWGNLDWILVKGNVLDKARQYLDEPMGVDVITGLLLNGRVPPVE